MDEVVGDFSETLSTKSVMAFFKRSRIKHILLIAVFTGVLLWEWRIDGLFTEVAAYGDMLELLWAIEWYREALFGHRPTPFFHPEVFHPEGWEVLTFAYGIGHFLLLLPLALLGGAAFAVNALSLTSLVVAYIGMYNLARRLMAMFPAMVVALLFTFWGGRWVRIEGHLHLLIASALLPWLLLGLERAFDVIGRRLYVWLVFVGVGWAFTTVQTFYFLWFGGLAVALWTIGSALNGRIAWRTALQAVAIPSLTTLFLVAPFAFVYWRAIEASFAPPFDISGIVFYSANLNSLPSPFIGHAFSWMKQLALRMYRGPIDETSIFGFGLLASGIFLLVLFRLRRHKQWWPTALVAVVGMVLALGPTLHWNHEPVQWESLRPLNHALWQIGHTLKPDIFPQTVVPEAFATAIPLPHYLLTATVPFFDAARTVARFTLVAAAGFYLVVGLGLSQISQTWLRLLIGVLLLLEVLPMPKQGVPFPPVPHPVFQWLQQQDLSDDEAIMGVYTLNHDLLSLAIGGDVIWATREHGQPIVGGTSAFWPPHVHYLQRWLWQHPYPFQDPEFALLLRGYGVRYILLHQRDQQGKGFLEQVDSSAAFRLEGCFDPSPRATLWNYPICVIKVRPSPLFDVRLGEGWSPSEEWGAWALGQRSTLKWVATAPEDAHFQLEAFPHCVEGQSQRIVIYAKEQPLAEHQWQTCEPWSGTVTVPATLVDVGWNQMTLEYDYALQPSVVTDGANPDARYLSVGFRRFVRQK